MAVSCIVSEIINVK